ncbi:TPA: hypothetical protein NVH56_002567 [Enterobacter hormaechei subsp. xiangfangensis]|nr:hypothetical protein [Enterobacter hormaechei subsp. xiangfangensis]
MECKVSDLVKRGHDQSAELKASCGAVDVRTVAQLISDLATQLDVQLARSNALAAENAGLKKFITQECHVAHVEPETFYEEEITRYVNADGYEPENPATDAFLAEVRAQGVEMLREHPAIKLCSLTHVCDEFAAQLRKGVQS